MSKFIQLSKKVAKKIVLLILFFNLLVILFLMLFYFDYQNKSITSAKNDYLLNINYYDERLKEKLLLFDNQGISDLKNRIISSKYIKDVKIDYNKYLFGTQAILFHTNSLGDSAWNLISLDLDIKFGETIKLAGTSFYEFLPSPSYDKNESLVVRYQLMKDGEIRNLITNFDLKIPNVQIDSEKKESFPFWFEFLYDNLDFNQSIKKELSFNNLNFATVEYKIDDYALKDDLYSFIIKFILYMLILIIPLSFWIVLYDKFVQRKYLVEPLTYLNNIIKNVLAHKFSNIDESKLGYLKENRELIENIDELSKKVGSLVNELNINRETLERNLLTDNLTGLYDKKMFEIDMKSMFVTSSEGYVFTLKISDLSQILSLNGSSNTDSFILAYANIISNTINEYKKEDIKFYRFYGSEFAILAKDVDSTLAKELVSKIINNLILEVSKHYKIPNSIFHIGATPFDSYGTIDSIMRLSNIAYEEARSKNVNCGVVVNESTIKDKVLKLEEEIKNIVDNNNFAIDFVFDSYTFEDNKLVMRELKPILKDSNNKDIAIGSFISVCEKLDLSAKFDKEVIKKAVEFFEKNKIDYKIAINLSIKSITNANLLEYIKDITSSNEEFKKHIIFSITAYSALAYKPEFDEFVKTMNDLDIEILLKRYKTKEFPLDELSKIGISYLRIDKDLTQGINNDLMKKHRMKNIVVYSEVNDVKLLTDSVQSNKDYEFLSKLDIYATSR